MASLGLAEDPTSTYANVGTLSEQGPNNSGKLNCNSSSHPAGEEPSCSGGGAAAWAGGTEPAHLPPEFGLLPCIQVYNRAFVSGGKNVKKLNLELIS